jgi:hypothetical protein
MRKCSETLQTPATHDIQPHTRYALGKSTNAGQPGLGPPAAPGFRALEEQDVPVSRPMRPCDPIRPRFPRTTTQPLAPVDAFSGTRYGPVRSMEGLRTNLSRRNTAIVCAAGPSSLERAVLSSRCPSTGLSRS